MTILQYAPINVSISNGNIVIPGNQETPVIQVVGIFFQAGISTTVTIKAGTTALTGPMSFSAGGGLNLPNNGQFPYFEVGGGNDFIISLSGLTGQIAGSVMYYQF